jgi:hypothetical protein
LRHRLHDRFVQILDGLDEVRLSEDEVDVGRLLDADGFSVPCAISFGLVRA